MAKDSLMRVVTTLLFAICALLPLAARHTNAELRIYYLGNLSTAPVARQLEIIDQLQQLLDNSTQQEVPTIVVTPGNLLGPHGGTPTRDSSALSLLAQLHPQALGVGDNELKLGSAYLKQKSNALNIPWLSNVWPAQNNFPSIQLTQTSEIKIAFTRLALPDNQAPKPSERRKISRQLSRIKQHNDLLILLGSFDEQGSLISSALFPQADIIIGNMTSKHLDTIGHTIVAPIDATTPYLGGIEIALRDGKLAAWRGGIIYYPLAEDELP